MVPVTGGFPLLWLSSKIFLKTHCLSTTCLPGYDPGAGTQRHWFPNKLPHIDQLPWQRELSHACWTPQGGGLSTLSLHNSPSCHGCILTPQPYRAERAPESWMPGFIIKGAPRCQLRCSLELPWLMAWRRRWQPIPVFLPGKFHGWRSLVGYSPWSHKESDTTEWLHIHMAWKGFPGGTCGKEPACPCRRHKRRRFDPWVGKNLEEGMATDSSVLTWGSPMDRGAWQATANRVSE